jgi:hypothetical protein
MSCFPFVTERLRREETDLHVHSEGNQTPMFQAISFNISTGNVFNRFIQPSQYSDWATGWTTGFRFLAVTRICFSSPPRHPVGTGAYSPGSKAAVQ